MQLPLFIPGVKIEKIIKCRQESGRTRVMITTAQTADCLKDSMSGCKLVNANVGSYASDRLSWHTIDTPD